MITVKNISKSYGDLQVLKDVSLEIPRARVVSLIGPSGAGKSTLLHIMGTLDQADSGSVVLNGTDPSKLRKNQLSHFRNANLGFIFQFHHLLPEFSAVENVMIPALIANRNKTEARKAATGLLSLLGLEKRLEHKPSELSGGEQQRVAVARALVNQPPIVLADEPSGNLDTQNARELHDLFFTLRENFGCTIVIVTHNEELSGMTDQTFLLRDGMLVDNLHNGQAH